jgi:hypothetical protein
MNTLPYIYAALLDVLGYRERLDQDRRHGTLHFRDLLESALRCLSAINDAEFAHQAISDTIILTCSDREKIVAFLRVLRDVQIAFLTNGLFLRGGLTYQQHFRSGAITYSPAYAGAHELESKMAIHPRIVVDHNIIAMFESSGQSQLLADSRLLCECNGVFFVNIIDRSNWRDLHTAASALYHNDAHGLRQSESAFGKHWWFQEYLMTSMHAPADAVRYIPAIRIWGS